MHIIVDRVIAPRTGRLIRADNPYARELEISDARSDLADIGDLGDTGIPALDATINSLTSYFELKTRKLETVMKIIAPASVIAAACGVLLVLGLGKQR